MKTKFAMTAMAFLLISGFVAASTEEAGAVVVYCQYVDYPVGCVVPRAGATGIGAIDGLDEYRVTPALIRLVNDWEDVYQVYASRNWMRTLDALEAFADAYPDDVLAGIYLDRVVGFMLEPPADSWDGVVQFSQK